MMMKMSPWTVDEKKRAVFFEKEQGRIQAEGKAAMHEIKDRKF